MSQKTFESSKDRKLFNGEWTATIKVRCKSHRVLNLRPVITVKGSIEEWQLLISKPPQIDWKAMSNDEKPSPGSPVLTPTAIRFHPDDVILPLDVAAELQRLRTEQERDTSVEEMSDPHNISKDRE